MLQQSKTHATPRLAMSLKNLLTLVPTNAGVLAMNGVHRLHTLAWCCANAEQHSSV